MDKRKAVRILDVTTKRLQKYIHDVTDQNSKYATGLAYEGYNGGYLHALYDVQLLLSGVIPNRHGWWEAE